jgi:hypothetical protein
MGAHLCSLNELSVLLLTLTSMLRFFKKKNSSRALSLYIFQQMIRGLRSIYSTTLAGNGVECEICGPNLAAAPRARTKYQRVRSSKGNKWFAMPQGKEGSKTYPVYL